MFISVILAWGGFGPFLVALRGSGSLGLLGYKHMFVLCIFKNKILGREMLGPKPYVPVKEARPQREYFRIRGKISNICI